MPNIYETRKRAIAKALQLNGHSDFAPVNVAYYQHFLSFLFENIAFSEVLRGNHKCRSRGATLLVNVKLECVQLRKHIASRSPNDIAPVILGFSFFLFCKYCFFVYFRLTTIRRHVAVATPTAQVATPTAQLK